VFIPDLNHVIQVFNNNLTNAIQFLGAEAVVCCQSDRLKPKLASLVFSLNVNVPRFVAVKTVEEEPIWAGDSLNGRHNEFPEPQATTYSIARK